MNLTRDSRKYRLQKVNMEMCFCTDMFSSSNWGRDWEKTSIFLSVKIEFDGK